MVQKLRERMGREEGFTLVELLVVMLILGILAAIAIPTFFNQRDKARDADAKVGARSAETAMETFATENGGDYGSAGDEATTEARLIEIEPTLEAANLEVAYPAGSLYEVSYASSTGNEFMIRSSDPAGQKTADCTVEGQDGCPTGGDWFGG
jgi:type II secretion system protein G